MRGPLRAFNACCHSCRSRSLAYGCCYRCIVVRKSGVASPNEMGDGSVFRAFRGIFSQLGICSVINTHQHIIAETSEPLLLSSPCEQCELYVDTVNVDMLDQRLLPSSHSMLCFQGVFGETHTPNYDVYFGGVLHAADQELYAGTLSFFGAQPKSERYPTGLNLKFNVTSQMSYLISSYYMDQEKLILKFRAQEPVSLSSPVAIEHIVLSIWGDEMQGAGERMH